MDLLNIHHECSPRSNQVDIGGRSSTLDAVVTSVGHAETIKIQHLIIMLGMDSGLDGSTDYGMGFTRAEDAQGTPTQSHTSPSILVYAEKPALFYTRKRYQFLAWSGRFCGQQTRQIHVQPLEIRVSGFGFRVSGFRFRIPGFGFRISGFGFRVSGFESQVSGLCCGF